MRSVTTLSCYARTASPIPFPHLPRRPTRLASRQRSGKHALNAKHARESCHLAPFSMVGRYALACITRLRAMPVREMDVRTIPRCAKQAGLAPRALPGHSPEHANRLPRTGQLLKCNSRTRSHLELCSGRRRRFFGDGDVRPGRVPIFYLPARDGARLAPAAPQAHRRAAAEDGRGASVPAHSQKAGERAAAAAAAGWPPRCVGASRASHRRAPSSLCSSSPLPARCRRG